MIPRGMTGINADLEALEAMYKAVLVEFKECASWQPILKKARRALNVLWEEHYLFQHEMQMYEQAFPVKKGKVA